MGDDITYSGTVSAAMEATLMGVPAFAVSLEGSSSGPTIFAPPPDLPPTLASLILDRGLPADTFLNVNVPAGRHRAGFALPGRENAATAISWWKKSIRAVENITGWVPANWISRTLREPIFMPFAEDSFPLPLCISI